MKKAVKNDKSSVTDRIMKFVIVCDFWGDKLTGSLPKFRKFQFELYGYDAKHNRTHNTGDLCPKK